MTKNINVKVVGSHGTGEDKDTVVSNCSGLYYIKNDIIYIKYSETDEDSGQIRNSLIKVYAKGWSVEHRGNTDAFFVFETGKHTQTTYVTPMGSMLLGIYTRALSVDVRDDFIELTADYDMSLGDGEPIESSIRVTVNPN